MAGTDCRIKGKRGGGGQLLLGLWPKPTPSSRERCEKVWGTFCFEKLVKRNCSGPVSASHVHLQPAAEPLLNCAVCQADGSTLLLLHCHLHFYSVTCSVTLSVQFHTVICSFTLSLAVLHCQCSFTIICSFVLSLTVLHCHLQCYTVSAVLLSHLQFCTVTCSFALSLAVLLHQLQFYLAGSCSEVCDLFCVCDTLKLGGCFLNFKTNIKNLCV